LIVYEKLFINKQEKLFEKNRLWGVRTILKHPSSFKCPSPSPSPIPK